MVMTFYVFVLIINEFEEYGYGIYLYTVPAFRRRKLLMAGLAAVYFDPRSKLGKTQKNVYRVEQLFLLSLSKDGFTQRTNSCVTFPLHFRYVRIDTRIYHAYSIRRFVKSENIPEGRYEKLLETTVLQADIASFQYEAALTCFSFFLTVKR